MGKPKHSRKPTTIEVSPQALKAALLFTWKDKDARAACLHPWAQRQLDTNVLAAFDGHCMIVINDIDGRRYPRKPRQVGGPAKMPDMPDWRAVIKQLRPVRGFTPIEVFAPYHAKVLRAAQILGVEAIRITTRGMSDPITYHLGDCAFAAVMPRWQGVAASPVPFWLKRVVEAAGKKEGR